MVPSTGPVTIQDVVNEFGVVGQPSGTAPHALKEFYGAAAGIPATGELTLFDFRGASAETPTKIVTLGSSDYTYLQGKITTGSYVKGYALNPAEATGNANFTTSTIGAIAPSTEGGVVIEAALYGYTVPMLQTASFTIVLQGNRTKSFFASVTPQSGNTLTSSSSTHSYDATGNFTRWKWTEASIGGTTVLGPNIQATWGSSGNVTLTFA